MWKVLVGFLSFSPLDAKRASLRTILILVDTQLCIPLYYFLRIMKCVWVGGAWVALEWAGGVFWGGGCSGMGWRCVFGVEELEMPAGLEHLQQPLAKLLLQVPLLQSFWWAAVLLDADTSMLLQVICGACAVLLVLGLHPLNAARDGYIFLLLLLMYAAVLS
ncbi:hypothetical protein U1Q18_021359 [Sarracenia purpurea var. burkii]